MISGHEVLYLYFFLKYFSSIILLVIADPSHVLFSERLGTDHLKHFSDFNMLFFQKKTCCRLLLKKLTCCVKREKKTICREEKSQPPPRISKGPCLIVISEYQIPSGV